MTDTTYLNVYLLSFNCGREVINASALAPHLFDAFKPASIPKGTKTINGSTELPDILVLNLQEVAPIAYAFLGGAFLTHFFDEFRKLVDLAGKKITSNSDTSDEPTYVNILTRNVGLTALMVFVRSDLVDHVEDIMTAGVGVGVHETGHKGAVGARIRWKLGTQQTDDSGEEESDHLNLTFVSAHLAPMEEALERRNQDYKDIVKGLIFTQDADITLSTSPKSIRQDENPESESEPLLSDTTTTPKSMVGMYTSPTHLFFAGDLNYRTASSPPSSEDVPSFPQLNVDPSNENYYMHLFKRDQLTAAHQNNETLNGLVEHKINFPPTYKIKYRLGSSNPSDRPIIDEEDIKSWEWASHRWPSWCDRIFFSPSPSLIPLTYNALPMVTTSDHRPVALSVLVPLKPISDATGAEFAKSAPVPLDPTWKVRRDAARRREIVAGMASYLALTTEGKIMLLSGLAALLGGVFLLRAW